jgi:hypothetical protein
MYSFSSLCSLWFRKKLNILTSGFLSSSDKEGLKSEFQVSAVGSHPLIYIKRVYNKSRKVSNLDEGLKARNIGRATVLTHHTVRKDLFLIRLK